MNREDLLFDYFENGLDPYEEDILFQQLNIDESLRKQFHQQMKIRLLAREDTMHIKAPFEATQNIFNTIGISQKVLQTQKFRRNFLTFIQSKQARIFPALILIALLIALPTFYLVENYAVNKFHSSNANIETNANSLSKNKQNYPIVSSSEDNANSPENNASHSTLNQSNSFLAQTANTAILLNSLEDKLNSIYSKKLNKINSDYTNKLQQLQNLLANNQNNLATNLDNPNNDLLNSLNNTSRVIQFTTNLPFNQRNNNILMNNKQNNYFNYQKPIEMDLFSLISDLLPKSYLFELNLIGINSNYTYPNVVLNNSSPIQYTYNITAYYAINENHKLGVSYGKEQFPQQFNRNIDGKNYQQIQNPYLNYYGVDYKYIPTEIFSQSYVLPYINLLGGATSVGPLAKLQLGGEISIFKRLALTAGIENSLLFYNVDNIIYSTNKVNFVYGINLKF
jgi:hypothetical protein